MPRPRCTTAFIALVALLFVCRPASALDPGRALTQYVHRIWQTQQGLPEPTIYSIVQDGRGYLWLGTQSGLVRFDGVRFTVIDDPALRHAWVQSLLLDRAGNLWVGTKDKGLRRVRDDRVVADPALRVLGDSVRTLLVDRAGAVWVVARSGARIATVARGRVEFHDADDGSGSATIDAGCQADEGTIWLGGKGPVIWIWNGAGFARYRLNTVPATTTVDSLVRTSDGSIWIGTTDGRVQVKDGRERLFTVADGLADNWILELQESREGSLWVGTRNGFSRVRPADIEKFGTDDGLSQSTVYALCEDREGTFWVGTKHGLNQFLDGRTIPYTTKEGLPSDDTGPLLQDREGIIWVGTLDAGLSRYDGHRFTVLSRRSGLASDTIRALALDARDDIWVGTDGGLNRLHQGRVVATYTTADGLPANRVLALAADGSGTLWIGTFGGLAALRNGRIVRPQLPDGLTREPVAALAEDPTRSSILVAFPAAGVYRLSLGERSEDDVARLVPVRDVDALYQDSSGVWMGTLGGGLRLVQPGRTVSYSMRDGLFDDDIYGIVADNADRLWMTCSKGIFAVARSDLLRFADGRTRTVESTPYSPTDALRTIEGRSGVQPGVWQMRDGLVWFSTIRGLIVLDPNRLHHDLPPLSVVVESVTANGRREPVADLHRLPPGARNVDFVYTALSFIVPSRITFRYLLEGFDRTWTNADTRREAIYTNLPPGDFRFRVIGCNVDGKCAEAARPVSFSIAPFVYQRRWFIPLCVAVAALAVWLVYRLRVRRLRSEFAIVLTERNRIARELHDTLIQGFSGITMELQALLGRLKSARERADLQEIINDAGWCLREARRSLAGLRSVQGSTSGLAAAIERTAHQATEGKNIRLRLHLDDRVPDVPAAIAYNLLKIAQEATSNAVNHADAVTIDVSLQRTPEGLRLVVKDDGRGFEGEPASFVQLGHDGLAGMQERANDIGAAFHVESARNAGTTVTVELPLPAPTGEEAPAAEIETRKTG